MYKDYVSNRTVLDHENVRLPTNLRIAVLDDPQLMAGAPVGLQCIGSKLGDAQLLRDVEMIDRILNGEKAPIKRMKETNGTNTAVLLEKWT
jgi:Asp-tRNA(Asn)/Glu-tRNA(Gln) amidotransferase A subunit family amidase